MKVLRIPVDGPAQLVEVPAQDTVPDGEPSRENIHKGLCQLLGGHITYVMHAQAVQDAGVQEHSALVPVIIALSGQNEQPEGPAFQRYNTRGPVLLATLDQSVVHPRNHLTDPSDRLVQMWTQRGGGADGPGGRVE